MESFFNEFNSECLEAVCHCINWHPSTKTNQGKKAICSYCNKTRQNVCELKNKIKCEK